MTRHQPALGLALGLAVGLAVALAAPPGAQADAAAGDPAGRDRRALARILEPPLGLPPRELPAGEPPNAAEVALGRKLFLDRRLSVNGTLSCAMCHVPEQGFASNELGRAVGLEGRSLLRSSPTLLNVAWAGPLFHDGREPDLELQALDVLLNPDEMAMPSLGALVARVRSLPDYRGRFETAFGGGVTVQRIGRALATYMRTLAAAGSPFDRWRFGGEPDALSPAARRGFDLFTGRAGCAACHTVGDDHARFTDNGFHDTGIGWQRAMVDTRSAEPVRVELEPGVFAEMPRAAVASVGDPPPADTGRFRFTGDPADRWRFRTPTLRNVALTAPYMHDGSIPTLREVVAWYDRGGAPHDGLDPRIRPLGLTAGEVDDLVAFLESLTSPDVAELVRDARSEPVGNPSGGSG